VSRVGEQAGGWRRWRDAMADALYGEDGFYRHSGAPAAHFRTSAHASPSWAGAIATLAGRAAERMPESAAFTVVEVGAGGGELLGGLAVRVPSEWRLVGVDVCPRPAGVPERVEWAEQLPASFDGVLIAVEWLDVVPVDVVERTDDDVRLVEVNEAGEERLGPVVSADTSDWLARWWPLAEVGDRAEVGRPRDEAWAGAVARIDRGVAVTVDYAAVPARDVAGTLTGYKEGRQVAPVPDGSMDITAHVLFSSLVVAASADAETVMVSQREALRSLGLNARRPSYDGDATSYLSSLSRAGDEAELIDPGGLGAFTWLVQAIGTRNPLTSD
jgi:SAM-dependent MidA family methyltransferase